MHLSKTETHPYREAGSDALLSAEVWLMIQRRRAEDGMQEETQPEPEAPETQPEPEPGSDPEAEPREDDGGEPAPEPDDGEGRKDDDDEEEGALA